MRRQKYVCKYMLYMSRSTSEFRIISTTHQQSMQTNKNNGSTMRMDESPSIWKTYGLEGPGTKSKGVHKTTSAVRFVQGFWSVASAASLRSTTSHAQTDTHTHTHTHRCTHAHIQISRTQSVPMSLVVSWSTMITTLVITWVQNRAKPAPAFCAIKSCTHHAVINVTS